MLREATSDQERTFLKNRKVGEGKFSEDDSLVLGEIVETKNPDTNCPNCGADLLYIERGNSYAVWCSDQTDCRLWDVVRGI